MNSQLLRAGEPVRGSGSLLTDKYWHSEFQVDTGLSQDLAFLGDSRQVLQANRTEHRTAEQDHSPGLSDLRPKSLPEAMQRERQKDGTKGTVAWSGQGNHLAGRGGGWHREGEPEQVRRDFSAGA